MERHLVCKTKGCLLLSEIVKDQLSDRCALTNRKHQESQPFLKRITEIQAAKNSLSAVESNQNCDNDIFSVAILLNQQSA
ncbi:MAG: hypothetical protein ACJAYR_003458 [Sneathiella sp.]|jgi:hypothetical protein